MYNKVDVIPALEALIETYAQEYGRTLNSQRIGRIGRLKQLGVIINRLYGLIEIVNDLPN